MANVLGELFQDIANAIRSKNGATSTMKPAQFPVAIAGIEVGADTEEINLLLDEINGEVVGQKLCYVTIMSDDGLTEIVKIPVYEGYDAENPFGTGSLGTPTKESTETQTFTYSGLSLTPGGKADELALKNVIDDRTVYVAFTASTRYYTVRFFDGDTLKNTVRVTYNGTASYTLAKEGWLFRGWEPSNENITADTDCYAKWEEQLNFADATWARINEICESGHAADHFAIDDEREIVGSDGTTAYVLRIVGINIDTEVYGSGKAGITVAITLPGRKPVKEVVWSDKVGGRHGKYWDYDSNTQDESNVRYWMRNTFITLLPTELQGIIKPVKKKTLHCDASSGSTTTIRESYDTVFVPSVYEIGQTTSLGSETGGVVYPGFATAEQRKLYNGNYTTSWITRTVKWTGDNEHVTMYLCDDGYIATNIYSTTTKSVYPCFCI